MNSVFAGAMITIMALCVFGALLPLGAVNPELAFPAFVLATVLAGLWAARLAVSREPPWNSSPMHWPVVGFFAYAAARYMFSPLEYEARIELFQVGLCGLVYFVCANQFLLARDRAALIVVLITLALFESGYGIWQAFSKSDMVLQWVRPEGYRGRASGTLICPNHLAGFLELVLGLVVARAAIVRRECQSLEKATILKVLTIYAAVMIIVGILLTFSRAGWAATVVGMSVFVFLGDWRPQFSWPRLAVVAVALGTMALVAWNFGPIRSYVLKSLQTDERTQTVALRDPSLGGRTLMWKDTVRMIQDKPIFGHGAGSWQWIYQQYKDRSILTRPDYTHNDFLNFASDYGLIGFFLLGAIVAGFYRHAWVMSRTHHPPEQRAFAVGATISVTSILFHSWFDSSLHIPGNALVLALILGCTAALTDAKRPQRRPMSPVTRCTLGAALLFLCGISLWFFVPTARATRYTDLGNLLKADLDYELALAYYDYAISLDPRSPEAQARRGDVYRTWAHWRVGPDKQAERRELARQAIEAYDRSLQLNPYQAPVLLDKAKMHEIAGNNDLARQTYQRAIEVYPTNAMAHFLLGCFFRDRGDSQRAKQAFEQAMQLRYTPAIGMNLDEARSPSP
jgi:O-antigen ligase